LASDVLGGSHNFSSPYFFSYGSPVYPTSNRALFNQEAGSLNLIIFSIYGSSVAGGINPFCVVANTTDIPKSSAGTLIEGLNMKMMYSLLGIVFLWNMIGV
jgi:hypothetical protein